MKQTLLAKLLRQLRTYFACAGFPFGHQKVEAHHRGSAAGGQLSSLGVAAMFAGSPPVNGPLRGMDSNATAALGQTELLRCLLGEQAEGVPTTPYLQWLLEAP